MYTYNITHNKHTIHINTHMMYIQNTYNNIYTIYIIHNWWCSDIYPGGRGLVGLEQPAAAPAALATLFTRNKSAVAWPRLAGQFVDVWWWEIASRTQSFPVQGTYIYIILQCVYIGWAYIYTYYTIYIWYINIYTVYVFISLDIFWYLSSNGRMIWPKAIFATKVLRRLGGDQELCRVAWNKRGGESLPVFGDMNGKSMGEYTVINILQMGESSINGKSPENGQTKI